MKQKKQPIIELLNKKRFSKDSNLTPNLSIVNELNFSVEKECDIIFDDSDHEKTTNFKFEESDYLTKSIEILASKMDIHKNGILFLKEINYILERIDEYQRKPIGRFFVSYIKSTKVTRNLLKACWLIIPEIFT